MQRCQQHQQPECERERAGEGRSDRKRPHQRGQQEQDQRGERALPGRGRAAAEGEIFRTESEPGRALPPLGLSETGSRHRMPAGDQHAGQRIELRTRFGFALRA